MRNLLILLLFVSSASFGQTLNNRNTHVQIPINYPLMGIIEGRNGDTLCWYPNWTEVRNWVSAFGGSGSVTSVIAGTGIIVTGTTTPTVSVLTTSINTTPITFGSNTTVSPLSTSVNGTPIVFGSDNTIAGGSPSGSAGGDLTGTYPNPTLSTTTIDAYGTYKTTVSLSSADILSLFTTPKQLVAAPGSGKYIMPIKITWDFTFVTTSYTIAGGMIIWENSDRSNPTWGSAQTTLPTLSSSQIRDWYFPAAANGSTIVQYADNQPLMLSCLVGDPTLGDGTANVIVVYKIITR